ncbi:aminotransferase class I/II-fold pyridoxal phosphate-dependent enzyme [Flagellimonas pelagia]|uniref:8-amino-7-oxononanoate synthase n=1 Tax=Flagellimonas pelagia TaxID=2306998 RepID=A0A3A1NIZ7_9FLAO|nr:8-amino-7-oxononanoate synthase [Allomuricauda maritima]RIV44043.1 8-amino-7-oxononanoate synthase [Allomuricauda maritima]TXJ93947.1 8-amino-7-oxononanoate synthase [Allomuricauda maritima]
MEKLPKKLKSKLAEREVGNALRFLPAQRDLIDFSSNDYLGFARNEEISNKTSLLVKNVFPKNGATGSRLLSGNHKLYDELEDFLVRHHSSDAALVFNSGYDANIGFFSSVPQRGDIVLYDELAHASIRDGIQMSHAKSYKFAHNDLQDLEQKIKAFRAQSRSEKEIYVVTESIFSMDGDSPDLQSLAILCKEQNCFLVVDEAHATGIFGQGRDLISQLGLQKEVFARLITFGKAIGCHGAAILGNQSLKEYLINFSRSFIYTTALSPHAVASILSAYQYLKEQGEPVIQSLQENISFFKSESVRLQLSERFIQSNSAIHCVIVPGNTKVKYMAQELQLQGFDVKPILSPTVKEGGERLRFCLHAFNTKEEISRILSLLKNLMEG